MAQINATYHRDVAALRSKHNVVRPAIGNRIGLDGTTKKMGRRLEASRPKFIAG